MEVGLKSGKTNFGSPPQKSSGTEIFEKFQTAPMMKDEKKRHSKFHRDHMNESWFNRENQCLKTEEKRAIFWVFSIRRNLFSKTNFEIL